jgi:hypothetical protein
MKHMLTEADIELNPQLEAQVGDQVEQEDILYPVIPTNFVGGKADNILRHANSPHYANNRINVMDRETLIKTYSGDRDGTNWKKHAELYAELNGYTLEAYNPKLDVVDLNNQVIDDSPVKTKKSEKKSDKSAVKKAVKKSIKK